MICLLMVKGRRLETRVASCLKWKVGGPGGPGETERNLSGSTSCIVPSKASKWTGRTGHAMQTSELLDNAQALGSTSL
jgi:hypothetical protein